MSNVRCRPILIALAAILIGPLDSVAQDGGLNEPRARNAHIDRHAANLLKLQDGNSSASPHFDAGYYELAIDIDFDAQRIDGRARVMGIVTEGPIRILHLDLSSSLDVDGVDDGVGTQLAFTHEEELLSIDLGRDMSTGSSIDVYIDYGGKPRSTGHGSFTFDRINSGPIAWTLSEPYGAREWWPGKDHPSDKADSVRLLITVPEELRVASNGMLENTTTTGGRTTFEWVHRYPVASYLISIAVGPYDIYHETYERPDSLTTRYGPLSLPVVHYVYNRQGGSSLHSNWSEVIDMLAVYEHWFGPYPFATEKYGHAEFTWRGGMEHQTMSSMGGTSIMLVAHEVVHQWYGNLVTLDSWPHLWLNEGFAAYGELLYWETMSDRYPGRFEIELGIDMQRARTTSETLVVADTLDLGRLFDANLVYAKGSVVLHMLRKMIGDELFRDVLHAYAEHPDVRFGTAATEDFQRIAEDVTSLDLSSFFSQWITHGFGHPEYAVSWEFDADDDTVIHLTIMQTQALPQSNVDVFEMPLTVLVETRYGAERHVILNNQRTQQFRLELGSRAQRLVLDPDVDLLRNPNVNVVSSEKQVAYNTELRSIYPNPVKEDLSVEYSLDTSTSPTIGIFDILGRELRRIRLPMQNAGIHQLDINVSGFAPGAYFIRINSNGTSRSESFILTREGR